MSEWKSIQSETPPTGVLLWGWDLEYKGLHLCTWPGKFDEMGLPDLVSMTTRGDDYWIWLWMDAKPPSDPLPDIVKAAQEASISVMKGDTICR